MQYHLYLLDVQGGRLRASVAAMLERLFAYADTRSHEAIFEPSLARDLGVDSTAYAAIAWWGEDEDPGAACWLQAAPVHLALQRDYFSLAQPAPLPLAEEERERLLGDINRHFAEQGLHFRSSRTGNWYLQADHAPELRTATLHEAVGQDVRPFQPQGEGAAYWKRFLNELQMLLHVHPVNQSREANGLLAVNSLWLSGYGRLPDIVARPDHRRIHASHSLARGLGRLTGAAVDDLSGLPLDVPVASGDAQGDAWIVMDADAPACEEQLRLLEGALRAGRLSRLQLTLFNQRRKITGELRRSDFWKFWRRAKPIQSY